MGDGAGVRLYTQTSALWYSTAIPTFAGLPNHSKLRVLMPPTPAENQSQGSTGVVELRPIANLHEHRACVALQREIWGAEFDEIVPASLMLAASHVGALSIGAFTQSGELVGFVFGLTGPHDGELVHWSHMLGVRASMRDHGIGRSLKESQRRTLAQLGIRRMYWTFDPLQAKNAHLNLNRLGARVIDYVPDMYGESLSPLHHAIATDRVVVECSTESYADDGARPDTVNAPMLTPFAKAGDVTLNGGSPVQVLIEVPWDLQSVVSESPAKAGQWRSATRSHFQWALSNDYAVTGLQRDATAQRAFFVIRRSDSTG
jgi:chorismate synthase